MAPPVSVDHSDPQGQLMTLVGTYRAATPGVLSGGESSLRLDMDNMPQPDVYMMIAPERGGQATIDVDRYLHGAPELLGEIAVTTASYDLHQKMDVYRRSGAREYIVWRTLDKAIDYFVSRAGRFERLQADGKGVWRSESFPGFWVDGKSLLAGDLRTALDVLHEGIRAPEHAQFVQRLRG